MIPKNKEILCIGEVLWDRLPDKSIPGGAPMNVALHLKNVGYRVMMCSSLGNDEPGKELLRFLERKGIVTDLIQTTHELPTSEVTVFLDELNNPTFDILEPVAWDRIDLTPELDEAARDVGTIVYGTLASRNEATRRTIHAVLEHVNVKLIDVNLRPPYVQQEVVENLVRKADIAKMNADELRTIAGWHGLQYLGLKDLLNWFVDTFRTKIICITRGKDGAMVLDQGKILEHPGYNVRTLDTVGSGDAFLAGFVSKLFDGKNTEEALKYACALGAYVATKQGATPNYSFKRIEEIMNQ